ncbi:MAG: hypothetical protein B7Z08_04500 [Sphingomonadales bacterium 32-68-7]|nr:MAG: hypothetical protein B7Z33_07465 [Sphingomonadales bacterium 12-68-11]OYX09591.1 MAG: hypothetical protein B7Z08_04500 [Sphingomonadales bacterium 32-68-7]
MAKRGLASALLKLFVVALSASAKSKRPTRKVANQEPKGYPVGIVGESKYQPAIRRCRIGEPVSLFREPGNPHDPSAIAVVCARGKTIGYIARVSFVQRIVHRNEQSFQARILSLDLVSRNVSVVLDVELLGGRGQDVDERSFEG